MPLQFYNTATRKIEVFKPAESGRVKMYHCGPTVYRRPHVGNYRAFLFADLLRRVLERRGLRVTQVMNLTDVGHFTQEDEDHGEDRMEMEARNRGLDPWQVAREITNMFEGDMKRLRAKPPEHRPRASDHIAEMLEIIELLLKRGAAYRSGPENANIYYEVSRFENYGGLSGNRVDALEAGARIDINPEKKHPADFALWKSDSKHIMKWKSRFGEHGFPGWHIECSAMARKYLGDTLDIHTGGEDLIFPHHECEIAQSEAATGKPFVNYWMHVKFLQVDGGKMSKSLGNVYSVDDVVARGFEPRHLRFLLQRAHYRTPLNFTWDSMRDAKGAIERLDAFVVDLKTLRPAAAAAVAVDEMLQKTRAAFDAALDDDMNAAEATAAVFGLLNNVRTAGGASLKLTKEQIELILAFLGEFDAIFDVLTPEELAPEERAEIDRLVAERQTARQNRDFARSDEIRTKLAARRVVVEDTKEGVRWRRV
ncbi:MAG: cysteine--tRNA ligase [Planctomycetes bacterium]|nr:cysteine--tRNA ligase [Planctomycetota bacterium]